MLMRRAGEGTLKCEELIRGAARSLGLVCIVTLSLAGVKDEATSTGDGVGNTIHTEVELVADSFILVCKVSMLSWTSCRGFGWLQILSS